MNNNVVAESHEQLVGVDMLKAVMATAVLIIHVRPLFFIADPYPRFFEWFIRLAVPFFFVASGYLSASHLEALDMGDIRRRVLALTGRYFRLYFCWVALYLPLSVLWMLREGYGILNYVEWVLIGNPPMGWMLWYVFSLMATWLIFFLTVRKRRHVIILFLCFALVRLAHYYIVTFLPGPPSEWVQPVLNEILSGGLYILGGMLLHRFALAGGTASAAGGIFLLLISLALYVLNLPFWELCGGAGVFLVALSGPRRPSVALLRLRNGSIWLFYTHIYALVFCRSLSVRLGIVLPLWGEVVVCITAGWLLAMGLSAAQGTRRGHFLGRLIT